MTRFAVAVLVAFFAVLASPPAHADPGPASHEAVVDKVAPAVVAIQATSKKKAGQAQAMTWFGTGVIVSEDGAVLSSTTVVPVDVDPDKVFCRLPGGKRVQAEFVAGSSKLEVAMIRLPKGKYPWVRFGDSNRLKLGHVVYTFGNCLNSMEVDDQVCVAQGEVSGFYKIKDVFEGKPYYEWCTYKGEVIETTAPLNPGVDGGPLIDAGGRLVGVMSLSYNETRWLGVAVPLHVIEEYVQKWLKGDTSTPDSKTEPKPPVEEPGDEPADEDDRGYLGATIDGDEATVTSVAKGSPAFKAGLQEGDRVTKVNDKAAKSTAGLVKMLRSFKPKDTITLTIVRDGRTMTLKVKLGYQPM